MTGDRVVCLTVDDGVICAAIGRVVVVRGDVRVGYRARDLALLALRRRRPSQRLLCLRNIEMKREPLF